MQSFNSEELGHILHTQLIHFILWKKFGNTDLYNVEKLTPSQKRQVKQVLNEVDKFYQFTHEKHIQHSSAQEAQK